MSKDFEQGGLEIPAKLTISNANKRMTDVLKEKPTPPPTPPVEEHRKMNSKPKTVLVLSIW